MEINTAELIAEERDRHFDHGHALSLDDQYEEGQLLHAALAYLCTPGETLWPFPGQEFKPSSDPVDNIVRAGAFLAAEGDRIQRRQRKNLPVTSGMIVLGMTPEDVTSVVDGLREVHKEANELKNLSNRNPLR